MVNRYCDSQKSDYARLLAEQIAEFLKGYSFAGLPNEALDTEEDNNDELLLELMQYFD